MKRTFSMSLIAGICACIGSIGEAPADDIVAGIVECDRAPVNGECRLAWDMGEHAGRSGYWVEAFGPEDNGWRRILGPYPSATRSTSDPVPGGYLYRVLRCPNGTMNADDACVTSTVVWAVLQPATTDVIPASLDDKQGVPMYVAKRKGGLATQAEQYNMYLYARLMSGLSVEDRRRLLPPMTENRFKPGTPIEVVAPNASFAEKIEFQIREYYEASREAARQGRLM